MRGDKDMMAQSEQGQTRFRDKEGCLLGLGLLVLIVIISAIDKCSSSPSNNNASAAMNLATLNMSAAIASQTPPPVEPLSATAASRGIAHLRLVFSAEGYSGAMVYSQNCYDALIHGFSWSKLDACGAFDAFAARSLDDADLANLTNEAGWFQSETAAARYLAAATGAGEDATEADNRLSQLQGRVARARDLVAAPAATDPREPANMADGVDGYGVGNGEEIEPGE